MEVHDLPSTQRAIAPHAAARNPYKPMHRWITSPPTPAIVPYASACVSSASQQKMPKHPNTASTSEYVPTHRWNTSPPVPDTNSICNLMDGIDFNKPFLPDYTGDNSKKDAFCTIIASSSRIFTYIIVAIAYMLHM
eukprot:14606885-Ditylum_brightwellii.AAC.2